MTAYRHILDSPKVKEFIALPRRPTFYVLEDTSYGKKPEVVDCFWTSGEALAAAVRRGLLDVNELPRHIDLMAEGFRGEKLVYGIMKMVETDAGTETGGFKVYKV